MTAPPPRLAIALLETCLPEVEREFVMGDVVERYRERGGGALWFWWQTARAIVSFVPVRRLRPRRRAGTRWLVHLRQDVLYGIRSLRRAPVYTTVAVATLAIGIGANTAIFSVVDHVLFRSLPFADPDRLVVLTHRFLDGRTGQWSPSFPDYLDYEAQNRSLTFLAAWRPLRPRLSGSPDTAPLRTRAVGVTANFFATIGVGAVAGRGFVTTDEIDGAPRVALISEPFWKTHFGGDPSILDADIALDGEAYTVVGIVPRLETATGTFTLPDARTQIWIPYRNSLAAEGTSARGLANTSVLGRLAPGVTLEAANADLAVVAAGLAERFPDMKTGEGAVLTRAREALVGPVRSTLMLLFGAVSLVLLIACSNVANLSLGRATARTREVALRTALGASRGRLILQFLTESTIVGVLAGGAAVVVTLAIFGFISASGSVGVPRVDQIAIDGRIVAFLIVASLGSAFLFGIVPALRGTAPQLSATLRDSARSGVGRDRQRIRQILVVLQVALAGVLVVGAGLLIRSFRETLRVDPGFDPSNVLLATVQLPMPFVSPQWPEAVAFFADLVERTERFPGVLSAAAAYQTPADDGWTNAFYFAGRPKPRPEEQKPNAIFRPVTPGYFQTVGIPLRHGRLLDARDDRRAPGAVVVNEAFVRRFFEPGQDPLGTRLDYGDFWNARPPIYEIVGVVGDARFSGLGAEPEAATYFTHEQQPVKEMTLLLKTAGDPLTLIDAVRTAVTELDPLLPIDNVTTLEDRVAGSLGAQRFLMWLSSGFGFVALTLASVGIYGVINFLVGQRTGEIGIRIALGASPATVRRAVLAQGMALAAIGLGLGLIGAWTLSRLLRGLLFGVSPTDPVTFAGVAAVLSAAALAACYLPARRATRLDPAGALRGE